MNHTMTHVPRKFTPIPMDTSPNIIIVQVMKFNKSANQRVNVLPLAPEQKQQQQHRICLAITRLGPTDRLFENSSSEFPCEISWRERKTNVQKREMHHIERHQQNDGNVLWET